MYYSVANGYQPLSDELLRLTGGEYKPGPIHYFLAEAHPRLIVVTNFDRLVESAFTERKRPYDLVVCPVDRKKSQLWWQTSDGSGKWISTRDAAKEMMRRDGTVILKLHGGVYGEALHCGFLITEDDYLSFINRLGTSASTVPKTLLERFESSRILFLGYGLNDWDVRLLLKQANVIAVEHRYMHWAFRKDPSEHEIDAWRQRGVKMYSEDLEKVAIELWNEWNRQE
jgi:hypothetical protein